MEGRSAKSSDPLVRHYRAAANRELAVQVRFATVDVFTSRQFGGNPLAVVPEAGALSTQQMQAIAAEFNLAETTFVLPPEDPTHTAKVRIFTPRAELPFAGHPNIGTAFILGRVEAYRNRSGHDTMVFEEKAGLVQIELLKDGDDVVGARLAAPQPLVVGDVIAPEIVADACSVTSADIETAHHRPCIASCGIPLLFAELHDLAALAVAQPRSEVFRQHLPNDRVTGVFLYVPANSKGIDIQARMFAPLFGVPEDPATGSANVTLVALLAELRSEPDLRLDRIIAQGIEMGRPSRLEASAEKRAGRVIAAKVGGRCVPMMQGVLDIA